MDKITETMRVLEILERDVGFERIFLNHGLNCVGCPGSAMETIKEAAEGHNIDLDKLLEDLNKYILTREL